MKICNEGFIEEYRIVKDDGNFIDFFKTSLLREMIPHIKKFVKWEDCREEFSMRRRVKAELNIADEWISVKDRLPDVYADSPEIYILCWKNIRTKEQRIEIGHLSEYTPKSYFEGVQSMGEKDFFKITHWMPLPDPPEFNIKGE